MRRLFTEILLLFLITAILTACGQESRSPGNSYPDGSGMGEGGQKLSESGETERDEETEKQDITVQQTEYLDAIPTEYYETSDQQGKVIRVTYESQDYTRDETAITKIAWVYLPYGYSENDVDMRYDILYLMHGWTMTADDFFAEGQSGLVRILDNLIKAGDIPPVIVVSATFDAENQSQSFRHSVDELSVFHNDLQENLMPYIESRYHTYAEDTTLEGFRSSREHRAFGGFSLGAVTTWYQFIYNLDFIKYFVPMSGDCWIMGTYGGRDYPVETVNYLENILAEGGYAEEDFRIYQGIGTDDPIWDQTNSQIQEMLNRSTFTPQNLHYAIIKDGRHDMAACERYLYYALQDFFGMEE